MLSYDLVDHIADSHNPVLGALWLALCLFPISKLQWRASVARVLLGLACLLVAYGMMWLDGAIHVWHAVGLDYSTHTAVATAMVITLAVMSPRAGLIAFGLLCLYVPLMLYQRYHTLGDILSTAVVVAPLCAVIGRVLRDKTRMRSAKPVMKWLREV